MTGIGILGGNGRMGRAIAACAAADGLALAGAIGRIDGPQALAALAARADALIDFSAPDALEAHLDAAVAATTPILVGTTGLGERHDWLLDQAADRIAVLATGNTSLGITLLAALVRDAAARLGADWDIEIVETHHRHKADAPSGTALLLGEAAAAGRGMALGDARIGGDRSGPRPHGGIGFASLRGGSVPGDHQVQFLTDGERLTLGHIAESRDIFARGALRAAAWLTAQLPGRYAMRDVLGLQ